MAGEQRYAFIDGSVGPAPGWTAPGAGEQRAILEEAFEGISSFDYEWIDDRSKVRIVSLWGLSDEKKTISFTVRSVSGGGRPGARSSELRAQVEPAVLNDLYTINSSGGIALLIGVYRNESARALVLWRPFDGSSGSSSVSKQIDAEVVAKALTNGVSSCVYPDGEIVFSVIPKLLRSYIDCFMPSEKKKGVIMTDANDAVVDRNLIFFGAPGTGKSYQLNHQAVGSADEPGRFHKENVRRVTFHPDYTYAQFIGCFKPYSEPEVDNDEPASTIKYGKSKIEYRFVPGPFVDIYVEAVKHPDSDYLLIIEEINRANPSAVFGDVFQLLDRGSDGSSEYDVAVSSELRDYLLVQTAPFLKDEFGNAFGAFFGDPKMVKAVSRISLPPNMYIWATMNSADQGVFPMDTAFKRRWDFRYMDINDPIAVSAIEKYDVPLGETGERVKWNDLRVGINNVLRRANINEDKWLGPFFMKPTSLADDESFLAAFKDKVLLYLYEDAAKSKPGKVFADKSMTYSEVCKAFLESGIDAFYEFDFKDISGSLIDVEDDGAVDEEA